MARDRDDWETRYSETEVEHVDVTPRAGPRARQQSHRDLPPPAQMQRTKPGIGPLPIPHDSIPVSIDSPVSFRKDGFRVSWGTVRKVVPYLLFTFVLGGGGVGGWWSGIKLAASTVAELKEQARISDERAATLETREHDFERKLNERVEELSGAWKSEAESNRSERATALRKLEDFAGDLEKAKKKR